MDWFMVRELKLTVKPHDQLLSTIDPLLAEELNLRYPTTETLLSAVDDIKPA